MMGIPSPSLPVHAHGVVHMRICTDTRAVMHVDVYTGVRIDLCVDMCMAMCMGICVDICIACV